MAPAATVGLSRGSGKEEKTLATAAKKVAVKKAAAKKKK
jgi:hypothetical protein